MSNWLTVLSGIPQGSVLGPLLFVIFVNELPEIVKSTVYLFADDTKIFRSINNHDDPKILQDDLNMLRTNYQPALVTMDAGPIDIC